MRLQLETVRRRVQFYIFSVRSCRCRNYKIQYYIRKDIVYRNDRPIYSSTLPLAFIFFC